MDEDGATRRDGIEVCVRRLLAEGRADHVDEMRIRHYLLGVECTTLSGLGSIWLKGSIELVVCCHAELALHP